MPTLAEETSQPAQDKRLTEDENDTEKALAPHAKGAVRASNVHIPVALLEPLTETKRTTRMSNGDRPRNGEWVATIS